MVKLQSTMVFRLDNKSIIGIELMPEVIISFSLSIALNSMRKQKQEEGNGLSSNIILLLKTFKRLTTILAQVLFKA